MEIEGVNYDVANRWYEGLDHHPKSIEMYKRLAEIDYKYCEDSFRFKSGGDGDNGEALMYLMDIYFDEQDLKK